MVSVRNCHLARSPFAIYYRDYSVDHEKIPRSNIVSSWPTCCYKLEIFDALRSGIFVVHMSYAFHWQVFCICVLRMSKEQGSSGKSGPADEPSQSRINYAVELDTGEELIRYRKHWWQLW